jgi:mono/diheme cytochrome c family protein
LSLLPTAAVLATKMTGQQKLGLVIVVGAFLAWAAYIVHSLMTRDEAAPPGSEIELAPNRKPYFDDEALETHRLDGALMFSLFMLFIIAIGLPLYWLKEPGRQKGAVHGFSKRAAQRGEILFESATSTKPGLHFGCADCHGADGSGGVTKFVISDPAHKEVPPRSVQWTAPPLNSALLRFSFDTAPAQEGVALDALRTILIYGRQGSPMPAWGLAGGGPMNDQQINDLVAYLETIQLSKPDATKFWAAKAAATAKTENSLDAAGNPIISGKVLFDTNCARCHTKGYSYGEPQVQGGGGQYAPNITGGSEIRQFPDPADQVAFVSEGVDFGKPYGTGGIGQTAGGGMPHFGAYLSQDEIKSIVDYERGL